MVEAARDAPDNSAAPREPGRRERRHGTSEGTSEYNISKICCKFKIPRCHTSAKALWRKNRRALNQALPDPLSHPNSPVYDEALDYQDVKLKIIQQEGYDAHDFNLFDDRASLLWRKPYVDGAVRELTAGNNGRSVEQLRRAVEQLMLAAGNRNPNVRAIQASAQRARSNIRVDVDVDQQEALIKDMRATRKSTKISKQ